MQESVSSKENLLERALSIAEGNPLTEGQIIGGFMAGVDFWRNVLSMTIQLFLASRIFKYLGIGGALFVLPIIAFGSYTAEAEVAAPRALCADAWE